MINDLLAKLILSKIICNLIENLAFIAGIVYASVYFNRFSLLWFLLIPLLNSTLVRTDPKKESKSDE